MSVRRDIRRFLDNPVQFAADAPDTDVWLSGLQQFAIPTLAQHGAHALRPAQEAAWRGLAPLRAGLVLGPPGTGKTHLLSWLILGYVHARAEQGLPTRVFVSAFTRNAIVNVLEAVAQKAATFWPSGRASPNIHFFGRAPEQGVGANVQHRERVTGAAAVRDALNDLAAPSVVVGGSVWSLYNLLQSGAGPSADGLTAEIFDLVCVDEASQMVLAHGLMGLGALKPGGRFVVAGDDKQLPPIRAERKIEVNERQLGGSLYGFLKSAGVQEFTLDETFRLNAPLVAFPERQFYADAYSSAVPAARLALRDAWREGLTDWEQAALDPAYPITIFLHDGPPTATDNPFEARLAARFADLIAERKAGAIDANGALSARFWEHDLAIVTPHVAQKSAIRNRLRAELRANAFVESVDRIQGKERDAIVLSYCVGDSEFAIAEGAFIFSSERLNVAITRARTKLIVLISRRLLNAAPPDQDIMDRAEVLREFVFTAAEKGATQIAGADGVPVDVRIRVAGFEGEEILPDIVPSPPAPESVLEAMTPELEVVLEAVREERLRSTYPDAKLNDIRRRLARSDDVYDDVRRLHALGRAALRQRGPEFWVARDLSQPRQVYRCVPEIVRERLEEVIQSVRKSQLAPRYDAVRDQFLWMGEDRQDVLKPIVNTMALEGLVRWGRWKDYETLDWVGPQAAAAPEAEADDGVPLEENDFVVLNALERLEERRINFGVVEGWTSLAAIASALQWSRAGVQSSLDRLATQGWVMLADEGRIRSRMAELAREVRYVKQRFNRNDAGSRPYLVRNLKLELRDRDRPARGVALRSILDACNAGPGSEWPELGQALGGLEHALTELWGPGPSLSGFQARAFQRILQAWRDPTAVSLVIAADTGAGKTEAACLPIIAGATADHLVGLRGVRAVLAYPRVRLAANQAQRLARYLALLAKAPEMPVLTLGMQTGQVPVRLEQLNANERANGWVDRGGGEISFPLFGCVECGGDLSILPGQGEDQADLLRCPMCEWSFSGWIGDKRKLAAAPPSLFLPTMDSVHQWLHNREYGSLFGDTAGFTAPRVILADEIHLYERLHGAQVGYALRRLMARAQQNDATQRSAIAIGMSATLGDPAGAWGRLIGRDGVELITPELSEKRLNPRGREYFYFIQPEIESRGRDVAGAATSIQALMCLAHGMRRRTGASGGYRGLVFLDSIDKVRRLHADYSDAELGQRLAGLRTRLYSDDPISGAPRRECCGAPFGCDRFRDGECWYFAATDGAQRGARGLRAPGQPLLVAQQPVTAAARGGVEALIRGSDLIFTTSSLEVGYDDPDMALVFQHYAPQNLASFVQRKGRGGRGSDDRPLTGVTLSLYSPRDSRWFRSPHQMVSPKDYSSPLNAENYFVRRGQMVCAMLDAFARAEARGQAIWSVGGAPTDEALTEAGRFVEHLFGPEAWRIYVDGGDLKVFWQKAAARAARGASLAQIRAASDWTPEFLSSQASATLRLATYEPSDPDKDIHEYIGLAFAAAAPGNASRRFSATEVYWRPPVDGRAPWFDTADYAAAQRSKPFGDDASALLQHLPCEARSDLQDLSAEIVRPRRVTLQRLGTAFGASFVSLWAIPAAAPAIAPADPQAPDRNIDDSARGELEGFPIIKARDEHRRPQAATQFAPWLSGIDAFLSDNASPSMTGLALAQVYWGAEAVAPIDDRQVDPFVFRQLFTDPATGRLTLHGHHVQAEGLQFKLNGGRLEAVVDAEMAALQADPKLKQARLAQMVRYRFESRAPAFGFNGYIAQRGALLAASGATHGVRLAELRRLMQLWSPARASAWFETIRREQLHQHPLLTQARVAQVGAAFADSRAKALLEDVVASLDEEAELRRFLRAAVAHSLAIRLRQSFVQLSGADERQIALHVRLPLQFDADIDDIVTVCETVGLGDGATRAFIDRLEDASGHWRDGFIESCPNAEEDAALERFFLTPERHVAWRSVNPDDIEAHRAIAVELGGDGDRGLPAIVRRVLFDAEAVGDDQVKIYELARDVRALRTGLSDQLGREATAWELASAAVDAARASPQTLLGRILSAYAAVPDAEMSESFSPEARLADQVYRLSARLCADGCQACLHHPSDLMSSSLTEASVSRNLLRRFVAT